MPAWPREDLDVAPGEADDARRAAAAVDDPERSAVVAHLRRVAAQGRAPHIPMSGNAKLDISMVAPSRTCTLPALVTQ